MTYEKAKVDVKNNVCKCVCYDWDGCSDENCGIWVALEALEKQISKKPINPIDEDGFTVFWNCPECDIQNTGDAEYCPHCGQAIDWSDEDD